MVLSIFGLNDPFRWEVRATSGSFCLHHEGHSEAERRKSPVLNNAERISSTFSSKSSCCPPTLPSSLPSPVFSTRQTATHPPPLPWLLFFPLLVGSEAPAVLLQPELRTMSAKLLFFQEGVIGETRDVGEREQAWRANCCPEARLAFQSSPLNLKKLYQY